MKKITLGGMIGMNVVVRLGAVAIPGLMILIAMGLAPKANADLIHQYDLTTGSFADILGGPSLQATGGSFTANGFSFGAGTGGLTLSNALPDDATYTIQMAFELDTVDSGQVWSDILNFHNSDDELYDFCSGTNGGSTPCTLQLYPGTGYGGIYSDVFTDMIFERDGSTNTVNAWLDGVQIISDLNDSAGRGIFNDANNIIRFFTDDPSTVHENSAGTVSSIEIYDQAYTPDTIPPSTPEPSTLAMFGGAALVLANKLRKRA